MHTIALHHILLKSSLLAQDIAQELELGADFTELAREYSACPSSNQGGFAGYHPQDDLPLTIITALATHNDERSFIGPIETPLGFHLLKPVGEKPTLALSDQNVNDQDNGNTDVSEESASSFTNEAAAVTDTAGN